MKSFTLDIIGNIKVDEKIPDRIKALVLSIRSLSRFPNGLCRFILKLHTPSEWLYNLVDQELGSIGFNYDLLRSFEGDPVDYGKEYMELLDRSNADYVLNFIEDHMFVGAFYDVRRMLEKMAELKVSILRCTFHKVELRSVDNVLDKYLCGQGVIFKNNQDAHEQQQTDWQRYFIGVNFLTTKTFAYKFWYRDFSSHRPHEYEIASYDPRWDHVCMIPAYEFMASIDDDHGIIGSCLLNQYTDPKKETSRIDQLFLRFWPETTPEELKRYERPAQPISLFYINNYDIKMEKLGNHLHGSIVRHFEQNFCRYVGAKYGVSVNSATNAISLCFGIKTYREVYIPSMIPPVVINALVNVRHGITFTDDVNWVGHMYEMKTDHPDDKVRIFDSAQQVNKDQYQCAPGGYSENNLMIFSQYPTKPVASIDGGMIVSDDRDLIEYIRALTMNGMSYSENNWDRVQEMPGQKAYMNAAQAYVANENLKKLDENKSKLAEIRKLYNDKFGLSQTSDHLYRLNVVNRDSHFMPRMKAEGIVCGIHYHAQHLSKVWQGEQYKREGNLQLVFVEDAAKSTVSIPFHPMLTRSEQDRVVSTILNTLYGKNNI